VKDNPFKVLLVDDDPDRFDLLPETLAGTTPVPFQLRRIERLREAEKILAEGRWDIVLLNLSLPEGQGTVASLRATAPGIPIAVLTRADDQDLALQVGQQGVQDNLVKDHLIRDLLGISLRHAIERNQLLEKLEQQMQAVEESEVHLRKIIESNADGFLVVDGDGVVRFVNPAAEALFDRQRNELLDHPFGFPAVAGKTAEVNLVRRDKGIRTVEMQTVEIMWEEAPAFLISLRDITQRKQREQERVCIQRLRAVGELAAGISHNLNNILTVILGPAQILQRKTDDPVVLREAENIITSVERARDLVHRLHLSVHGEEEDRLQSVPVNEVVQEAVQINRFRWKDEPKSHGIPIEVVTELGDVPPIRGTASRLHEILTNLLFNAVDAMSEGGTITIATQTVEEGVQLTFRDTGIGMDEETRRRVFEPFFTTKQDVGSGLGLSTTYGTVSRWGGHIEVESQPGEGTTFTFFFPVWAEVAGRSVGNPMGQGIK